MSDDKEQYLENLLKTIQSIASGDFNSRINDQSEDEILNVVGLGINMLGEEITKIFEKQQKIQEELTEKNKMLLQNQEEIQTMNEELQASNEELISTNDELILSQNQLSELNISLDEKVKERTEKIQTLLHQKDQFIIQLGHDLKTPMGPLINLIPIIQKKVDNPDLSEMITVVNNSVIRLKFLMDKMLKLALLAAPSTNFTVESLNIVSEIQSMIDIYEPILREKNIRIINNFVGELICDIDKAYFAELIDNILGNAIKYSGSENRFISLDYSYDDQYLTISISDNGIGLSERQINKIFDDFYKGDESRHDLISHGLGLSISKKIVEKHHGTIWAESQGIGKGTTFYIKLPWKQISLLQTF